MEGSKTFHVRHSGKVGCLDISNVVNINVDKFGKYQPHGEKNHLLCAKKINPKGKMYFPTLNYFRKSSLSISTVTLHVDYQKQKKTIAKVLCMHMDV